MMEGFTAYDRRAPELGFSHSEVLAHFISNLIRRLKSMAE